MRILGIDASSTTIGWGCLDFDDNWQLTNKQIGFIKPPKDGHIATRLQQTKTQLSNLYLQLKPDRVVLEDILLQHPKTTIKTLAILAVFNRLVCLSILESLNILPDLFVPLKIRHAIKLTQGRQIPKKEEIPALMEHHLGKIDWPSCQKGKYKGQPIKEHGDIADALACAFALSVIIQKDNFKKIKENKRESKRSVKNIRT